MLIGAHAEAVYAPERSTKAIDVVVRPKAVVDAERQLSRLSCQKQNDLILPSSNLDLFGSAWRCQEQSDLDILSSNAPWLTEAFASPHVLNQEGQRVIPLAFLVLIEIDSARGIDQGDLSRMLGRLEPAAVDSIIATVTRHYPDKQIADDIRQYAQIGSWEYMTENELRNVQGRPVDLLL